MTRTRLLVAAVLATAAVLLPTTSASADTHLDRKHHGLRIVTYPGEGREVHLDAPMHLGATSRAFRALVHKTLVKQWQYDPRPECRSSALVVVKTWRSDGFAYLSNVGMFGNCPGGGYEQIAVKWHGKWRAPVALGTQSGYDCAVLQHYRVPVDIAGDSCWGPDDTMVAYTGPA